MMFECGDPAYSEDLPTYLRITDISDEGYFLCDKKTSVAVNVTDENYLSDGDIVLARTGASVGKSYKFRKEDGKLVFAGFLIRVKPDHKKINSTFLFGFFSTEQYWDWVGITSARSGQPGINGNEYATLLIPVPPHDGELSEQQKIADCLASLDELITLEAQKLDTLKTQKKGLMQQLFPAEGETLPKLRFLEFREAEAWEERKAGALFANRAEDGEEGLPIYSVTMNDGMVKRSSLERRVDDIAESGGNKKVRKGDIAYNMMRMWQGAFGVAPEDCMVSPAYVVLLPESEACPDFFGYLFKLPKYLQLLTSHSQGLTLDRLRLYYKDFARIPVLIPSPPEQQEIADCLASLDDLITAQTQKLAALKTHKKGLMQQLFPTLDEVPA